MIKPNRALTCLTVLILTAAAPATESTLSREVVGQRLSDKEDISLAEIAAGEPCLVLAAFSKDAGERMPALVKSLRTTYPDGRLTLVQMPVIAGVPALFRGMARNSLKKSIPEDRFSQTLVVVDRAVENKLREELDLADSDAPHALALDEDGRLLGATDAQNANRLAELARLVAKSARN